MEERDDGLEVGRTVRQTRPAVPAASIMIGRDGSEGLEIFMLERHIETDFAGGALVFPGGKVDDIDRSLPPRRWRGIDLAAAVDLLEVETPEEALGLHVAAVREAFEEAGVLYATRRGRPVTSADLRLPEVVHMRQRMASRDDDVDWRPWLEEHDIVLDLGRLGVFSWWVTPDGLHRRYDTRFFVAAMPEGQAGAPRHDDVETTSSVWLRPADALAAGREGGYTVIYPTRKNLEALAEHPTIGELEEAVRAGRVDRRRVQPVIVEVEGRLMVQHPDGGPPEPG